MPFRSRRDDKRYGYGDAAVAGAQDEKNREDRDAKQMEDIATKEATDAADTMKDATRMRKDAAWNISGACSEDLLENPRNIHV